MGTRQKPVVVVSAVNFSDFGPFLSAKYGDAYDIVALVHNRGLIGVNGIEYLEFPRCKTSWVNRLRFEFATCNRISRELKPFLWLSLHDITPRVSAERQAVYCHNPSPFYDVSMREAILEPKFALFNKFYALLYRLNIQANDYVIVQQEWLRREFEERYGLRNVIVAHPKSNNSAFTDRDSKSSTFRFIYPCFPRVFKNIEVVLTAARTLEEKGRDFEVLLTLDGSENRYSKQLRDEFCDLTSVRFLGRLCREDVFAQYAKSNCLIFPSKLETWGLPITEFKATGKPMLVADLPYARETVGSSNDVVFFSPTDSIELANLMEQALDGTLTFCKIQAQPIRQPFANDWGELFQILLA